MGCLPGRLGGNWEPEDSVEENRAKYIFARHGISCESSLGPDSLVAGWNGVTGGSSSSETGRLFPGTDRY